MSTPPPPPQDESIIQHVARVCKNSFTKCFGLAQTADEIAKIKYKEHQIETRKKNFGIAYYALVANPNSTEQDKKACVDAVLADVAVITAEIATLQAEIDRVNNATQEKIVPKPGGGAGAAPAATTGTTAAATTTPAPEVAASAPPPPAAAPATTATTMTTTETTTPKPEEMPADEVDLQEVPLEASTKQ